MKNYISIIAFIVFTSNSFGQPSDLTIKVMDKLGLHLEDCEESLFAEKVLPFNNNLSVIVIPKIGKQEEDWYILDSYIVVVNNKTKKIKHLYFESYKTSGWESDAVFIYDITIDTAKYLVQEKVRAFGVVLHTRNMSQPNPYNSKYISLFIPEGDTLQNILKNYEIYSYGGETDMNCFAKMYSEDKTLLHTKNKTNSYFDINVDVLHTKLISKDCIESKTTTKSNEVLKFTKGSYKYQKQ